MGAHEFDACVAHGADGRCLVGIGQCRRGIAGAVVHRRAVEQRERQPLCVSRLAEGLERTAEIGGGTLGVAQFESESGRAPHRTGGLDRRASGGGEPLRLLVVRERLARQVQRVVRTGGGQRAVELGHRCVEVLEQLLGIGQRVEAAHVVAAGEQGLGETVGGHRPERAVVVVELVERAAEGGACLADPAECEQHQAAVVQHLADAGLVVETGVAGLRAGIRLERLEPATGELAAEPAVLLGRGQQLEHLVGRQVGGRPRRQHVHQAMAGVERLVVTAGLVEHVDPAQIGPKCAAVQADLGEPSGGQVDQIERRGEIAGHRRRLGAHVHRPRRDVGGALRHRELLEANERDRRPTGVVAEATTDLGQGPRERAATGARTVQVVIGEQVLGEREGGGVGHRCQAWTSSMGPTTTSRSSISITRV